MNSQEDVDVKDLWQGSNRYDQTSVLLPGKVLIYSFVYISEAQLSLWTRLLCFKLQQHVKQVSFADFSLFPKWRYFFCLWRVLCLPLSFSSQMAVFSSLRHQWISSSPHIHAVPVCYVETSTQQTSESTHESSLLLKTAFHQACAATWCRQRWLWLMVLDSYTQKTKLLACV